MIFLTLEASHIADNNGILVSPEKLSFEELNFVKKRRKYTSRLAREIVRQVLADDIKTVAENNDVSSEEIETMLRDRAVELRESKPLLLKK